MSRPTMKSIIERLRDAASVDDDCNCNDCIDRRLKDHSPDIVLEYYSELGVLPRNYDMRMGFHRSQNRGITHGRGYSLQTEVLRGLNALRKENEERKDRYGKKYDLSVVKTTYCVDCGIYIRALDSNKVKIKRFPFTEPEDTHICMRCNENYMVCSDCGLLVENRTGSYVFRDHAEYERYREEGARDDMKYVCRSCYRDNYGVCELCGYSAEIHRFEDLSSPGRRMYLCGVCVDGQRTTCDECSAVIYKCISHRENKRYYCIVCSEMRVPIQRHDFKPHEFRFHSDECEGKPRTDTLYFGFELETERRGSPINREAMAILVKEKYGIDNVYVVHDGSIEDGIEVVSHPFTWQSYRKNREGWDDLVNYIKDKGWNGKGSRCGFHIHLSKNAFTPLQIYKLMRFVYSKENRKFVEFLAGRGQTSYAMISPDDAKNLVKVAKDKKNRPSDRVGGHYHAVNLNGDSTIELRFFRGVTEPVEFHRHIECARALYEFTKNYAPTSMTPMKFKKFLNKKYKQFKCLAQHVSEWR